MQIIHLENVMTQTRKFYKIGVYEETLTRIDQLKQVVKSPRGHKMESYDSVINRALDLLEKASK